MPNARTSLAFRHHMMHHGDMWQHMRRCGECAYGAIDQALNGNGRWAAEWYPVRSMTLLLSFDASQQP